MAKECEGRLTAEQARRIEHVLRHFDFRAARRAMRATRHRWRDGGEDYLPDLPRLRATGRRLLEAATLRGGGASTGGFTAEWRGGVLALDFRVAESTWEEGDDECGGADRTADGSPITPATDDEVVSYRGICNPAGVFRHDDLKKLLARLDAAEAERDRLREAAAKADGALASCWCVAQDALAYGEGRYGEDLKTCSPWTDLRDAADKASAARAALRGAREGGLIHTTGGVSCPKN